MSNLHPIMATVLASLAPKATSHTPGPWAIDEPEFAEHDGKTLLGYYVAQGKGRGRICKTFANCLVTTDGALLANTRLIAAAPELLEALKTLAAEEHRDDDDAVLIRAREQARTAIAKAEGK